MNRYNLRSTSFWAAFVVMLFTAVLTINGLWNSNGGLGWQETIKSDAKGYYSYLTATFLTQDLGHEKFAFEYVNKTPNGTLNKYFCGTAITMAPWFAIGHGLALLDPTAPKNGYSEYEMKAITIGAWVYLLAGLLAFRELLLRSGAKEGLVTWLVLGLGLATPLLQYTAIQAGWSHIYSFCAISFFLLSIHLLSASRTNSFVLVPALLFGLIVLIRPVNGLVLLAIPIVLGANTLPLIARLVQQRWWLLLAVITGLCLIALQPLLWHAQTGNWFEWGYRNEGFYWDRPMVYEVLFGIRRGLFVWTPLFILPAVCTFVLWRYDRVRSVFALLYWATTTYVISCWWIWYYGSGFASRVHIDHYSIYILPLALVLPHLASVWYNIVRAFIVLCITFFLFQYWQFRNDIIHHEHMDAAKYAHVFLRTDDRFRNCLGGRFEEAPYHPDGLELILAESTDLERETQFWKGKRIVESEHAYSGNHVCIFDEETEFGRSFDAPPGSLPPGRELFLQVALMRYEEQAGDAANALCITSVTHADGTQGSYNAFRMEPIIGELDNNWAPRSYQIPVPALKPGDALRFYVWNQDLKGKFLIDDLMMRISAVR